MRKITLCIICIVVLAMISASAFAILPNTQRRIWGANETTAITDTDDILPAPIVPVIELGQKAAENTTVPVGVAEAPPVKIITEAEAFNALVQAQDDAAEMQAAGLGTDFVNDKLMEAKDAFAGANVSQALQQIGETKSEEQKKYAMGLYLAALEAARTEAGENYTKIGENYTKVVEISDLIRSRKEQAYKLMDDLELLELDMNALNKTIANYSLSDYLYIKARTAFQEERYEESRGLINQTYASITTITIESTRLRALLKASRRTIVNFTREHWLGIIITLAVLLTLGAYAQDKAALIRLKRKIKDMNIEDSTLLKLMKEAQKDYYQTGEISRKMFDIKMQKYKERKTEIKERLPVLNAEKKEHDKLFVLRMISWLPIKIRKFIYRKAKEE
jgi:hypothetical protein